MLVKSVTIIFVTTASNFVSYVMLIKGDACCDESEIKLWVMIMRHITEQSDISNLTCCFNCNMVSNRMNQII